MTYPRDEADYPPGDKWKVHAACAGQSFDLFVVPEDDPYIEAMAKQVCATCTVRSPCLEYGLRLGMVGVWGGTDWHQRRRIVKARALNDGVLFDAGAA